MKRTLYVRTLPVYMHEYDVEYAAKTAREQARGSEAKGLSCLTVFGVGRLADGDDLIGS